MKLRIRDVVTFERASLKISNSSPSFVIDAQRRVAHDHPSDQEGGQESSYLPSCSSLQ